MERRATWIMESIGIIKVHHLIITKLTLLLRLTKPIKQDGRLLLGGKWLNREVLSIWRKSKPQDQEDMKSSGITRLRNGQWGLKQNQLVNSII